MTNIDATNTRPRSEAGSAYLATLLVLVVLTLLGLSLAVLTQTEVLIGTSEKQATRQVYAAGTGVQNATAFALTAGNFYSRRYSIAQRTEDMLGDNVVIGDDICTSMYYPLNTFDCNLCTLNEEGFVAAQWGVTVAALRRGDATLSARKLVGSTVVLEPMDKRLVAGALGKINEQNLQTRDDDPTTMDTDSTTETDPCEGLFLKI